MKRRLDKKIIVERWLQGETAVSIAKDYGVTHQCVYSALKKLGHSKNTGGKHLTALKTKRNYSSFIKSDYGCSREVIRTYSVLIRRAYREQLRNARQRHIEWELTLPQWAEIWMESGKFNLRGRGKYVMCRKNDMGPYSIENVRIDTQISNAQEYQASKKIKMWIALF